MNHRVNPHQATLSTFVPEHNTNDLTDSLDIFWIILVYFDQQLEPPLSVGGLFEISNMGSYVCNHLGWF